MGGRPKVGIGPNDDPTITYRSITSAIDGLALNGTLSIQSGELEAGTIFGGAGLLEMTGGTLLNTQITGVEAFAARITSGTSRNVTLSVDAMVPEDVYGQLSLVGGLTLEGRLEVAGVSRYSYLYLQGAQEVGGSGTLALSGTQAYAQLQNQDSATRELATFGADLTVEGSGWVGTSRSEDRVRMLGEAIGDDGVLRLSRLDNGGETLRVSSTETGAVRIETLSENLTLDVAAGADPRIADGTHTGLRIIGAGEARLAGGEFVGLSVTGSATVEGLTASASADVYATGGLEVDGTLSLAGSCQRGADLFALGGQTFGGDGEIVLSRANALEDETVGNRIVLQSPSSSETETLVFGADLTLRGEGAVTTIRTEDRISVLGLARGENGGLQLHQIDQGWAALVVDASAGEVPLGTRIDHAVVRGFAPEEDAGFDAGAVRIGNGLEIRDVAFEMDAILGGDDASYERASAFDGLTVDVRFAIAAGGTHANLYIYGEQTVAGGGTFALSGVDARLWFASLTGEAETLSFGAGLTLAGAGRVEASRSEDSIRILGAELTSAAARDSYAYLHLQGEQTLGGAGRIVLGDPGVADAADGSTVNQLHLAGLLSAAEIVTLGADLEIVGRGRIEASSGDGFRVEGAIRADDGALIARDLEALEGVPGARDDGILRLDQGLALTERGTLEIGLSGAGDAARAGRIEVTGALSEMGTLALDVEADFDAEIGDTFVILTATAGFDGAFDAFEGFDLESGKAFELIEQDPNTLAIRVTIDEIAELARDYDIDI